MKYISVITACNLLAFVCLVCMSCHRNDKTDEVKKPAVAKELPAAVEQVQPPAEQARPPVEKDLPPIAYWNFDEGNGLIVKDKTSNGHDGIIMANGKRTAWVEGRLGRALEFNADRTKRYETGCVEIPKMGGINLTNGLTVELWVKFKTVDTKGTNFQLIGNEKGDTGPGFHLFFSWSALYLRAGSTSGKHMDLHTNRAQVHFQSETWCHVAATFDGTVARLYLDGKEVAASAPGFAIEKGRDNIYIGAAAGGEAYGLEGAVSEVKLYDYARSAVQVIKATRF